MARDAPLPDPLPLVDCDDGRSIVYTGMSTDVGRQKIVNEVNAQRVADDGEARPTSRKYTAQDSRTRYGPRQYSANDLQLSTDEQVDAWARALLDLRAYPRPALSSITVEVADVLPWARRCLTALLGVDVGDPLRVVLGSRGDPQTFDAVVVGVGHAITPQGWTATLQVGPYTSAWGVPPGPASSTAVYGSATYDEWWGYGTEVGTGIPPGTTVSGGQYDDAACLYDAVTVYDAALAASGRW
jgi:hypothetical protein